jgi:hypothetical protein
LIRIANQCKADGAEGQAEMIGPSLCGGAEHRAVADLTLGGVHRARDIRGAERADAEAGQRTRSAIEDVESGKTFKSDLRPRSRRQSVKAPADRLVGDDDDGILRPLA